VDAGALLGSRFGWERANVFAPAGSEPDLTYSWELPEWTPWCAAEQAATRESVAVFDQSSFGKVLVKGPDAEEVLQLLCTADVAVAPGRAVYTGMLNRRGGYEADVTVTRLTHDEYLVVTSATSPVRDVDWISRHVRADQSVAVLDVSSTYAVLGVMGPRSRALIASLTRADLCDKSFRFADTRMVDLGHVTVRATRITYVGELGWELYVPTELALGVYDLLMEAGQAHGVRAAGYYAINAMRLDKGYRAFGAELTPDHDPVQAGLMFACKLRSTHAFIGREAVERAAAEGPRRRLASFVLDDPGTMMWGGEVIRRDGELVGQVTSAAWSHSVGSCVSLGYVGMPGGATVDVDFLRCGVYTVDVAGREVPATLSLRAPFDPEGARIRA
jgi:4-methylaminobutanoate oxidase (formaldehyde-forming)